MPHDYTAFHRTRAAVGIVLCCLALSSVAHPRADEEVESGRFRLHKFEQPIGEESYAIRRDGDSLAVTDTFQFTDRGRAVPLDTTLRLSADLTPQAFTSKGRTSRFTTTDIALHRSGSTAELRDGQETTRVPAPAQFVAISGYSPIAAQMLMLRYWLRHGSPASLPILPSSTAVQIRLRGHERVEVGGRTVDLDRYAVTGLIWGREWLWLDSRQRLAAAVTIDAESDHFEAVDDAFETLLPRFVAEAGADGMAALADFARGFRREPTGPLAIVHATLVDGTGRPPIADSAVVVRGGRIVAAGPRTAVAIPRAATVIDATGKTLLPGLWDMHAHFEQVEWGPIYLAAGVTTARDVGNELEFITAVRDAIRDGRGLGPQLLLAGVVDGSGPQSLGVSRVDSAADAAHWVDVYKKNGFQQIKIYSSMTADHVKAVCDDAHRAGMTVTGHIPAGMTVMQGVDAGMDQVNHIPYVLEPLMQAPPAGARPSPAAMAQAIASIDLDGPRAHDLVAFLKAHHTVVDPTLAIFELQARSTAEPAASVEPGIAKVARELERPLTSGGMPPEAAAAAHAMIDKELGLVELLHRNGVPIVAGTDQAVPGHSLHRELELYVKAGFTPMEAIQAATLVPATVMGVANEVGTIEAGKRADLILLDANPLDDIHNIRSVRSVVANGVLYDAGRLWESVGFRR